MNPIAVLEFEIKFLGDNVTYLLAAKGHNTDGRNASSKDISRV
jgi:hypothetical protein